MKNLNKHIQEYYQGTKFLGTTTHIGEVSQDQVGYHGRTFMTDGAVRLKRLHKATKETPVEVVRYNLQGR
jgi:hypothetical protein